MPVFSEASRRIRAGRYVAVAITGAVAVAGCGSSAAAPAAAAKSAVPAAQTVQATASAAPTSASASPSASPTRVLSAKETEFCTDFTNLGGVGVRPGPGTYLTKAYVTSWDKLVSEAPAQIATDVKQEDEYVHELAAGKTSSSGDTQQMTTIAVWYRYYCATS